MREQVEGGGRRHIGTDHTRGSCRGGFGERDVPDGEKNLNSWSTRGFEKRVVSIVGVEVRRSGATLRAGNGRAMISGGTHHWHEAIHTLTTDGRGQSAPPPLRHQSRNRWPCCWRT